jgi:hypothetical protein
MFERRNERSCRNCGDLWVQRILLPIIRFVTRKKERAEQLRFILAADRTNDESGEISS